MTEFECGCRIMSDCIDLNRGNGKKLYWPYPLKTFVNICGKCGKKQIKQNSNRWKTNYWKWKGLEWTCL